MSKNDSILFNGREYSLCASLVTTGERIPDFKVIIFNKGESEAITLGKDDICNSGFPILISVVTSLDTPFGRAQTKKFNELLKPFSDRALLWSISSDLPFNINRFFQEEDIGSLSGASDYLHNSFGKSFGVMVEEVKLLVRSVFVIDRRGILRYSQIPIMAQTELDYTQTELDYDMAVNVLHELVNECGHEYTDQQEAPEQTIQILDDQDKPL